MDITRVAFVVPKLGRGGAERVVYLLVKEFHSLGVGVLCVCLEELGGLGEELLEDDYPIICLNSNSGYDYRSLISLKQSLTKFKPDVVNIHGYSALPYVMLARFFCHKYKAILTAHGMLYPAFFARRRFLYRFFSFFLSGLTAVSVEVGERHREFLGWSKPIEVIKNGVPIMPKDIKGGATLRNEFGISSETLVFLVVGNIRPEKGIEDLLEAVALLSRMEIETDFCVVVAGAIQDVEYARKVKELSASLGLESRVLFIGHRKDLSAVYSAGDVFLLSSRSEGVPMVVLEAMSCQMPIISTKVGGVPDVLEGYPACLVDVKSPEQLSQAMFRFLTIAYKHEFRESPLTELVINSEGMAEKYLKFFRRFF